MTFTTIAARALPEFILALQNGLSGAAAANPELGDVEVTSVAIVLSDVDIQEPGRERGYYCQATVAEESPCVSYVHLPDLDNPQRLVDHFQSDVEDWIVETDFGWGLELH